MYGETIQLSTDNESNITVYHVDEKGEQISEASTHTGEIGSEFNIKARDIEGYTPHKYYLYNEVIDDTTIDFEEVDQIVAIVYTKQDDSNKDKPDVIQPDDKDKSFDNNNKEVNNDKLLPATGQGFPISIIIGIIALSVGLIMCLKSFPKNNKKK